MRAFDSWNDRKKSTVLNRSSLAMGTCFRINEIYSGTSLVQVKNMTFKVIKTIPSESAENNVIFKIIYICSLEIVIAINIIFD